jgi:hypothetical protein
MLLLCVGCFGGSGGGGGNEGGGAGAVAFTPSGAEGNACERVISSCPSILDDFGLTTTSECESSFECVSGLYASMPSCRAMLNDLYGCFEGISSSDCGACDAELDAVMQCPEPVGCVETGGE